MYIIGELINGTSPEVAEAIKKKDRSFIRSLAQIQVQAGSDALDVNCGPASSDPVSDMQWLVESIQGDITTSLSLDSTKPEVIEAGLKLVRSKAIINSTTADPEKLGRYMEMAQKYKASLIALTIDKKGIPQDKDRRLELAAQILSFAQEVGFPLQELYLDPILMPINVAQNQLFAIMEAIRDFKMLSHPAPKTVLGLSNISQGARERPIINRTFLVMAQAHGLDAAILNPLDRPLMDAAVTAELILNKNIYCDSFLQAHRKSKNS